MVMGAASLVVYGIRDLSSTDAFVLLYVPWLLAIVCALWAPATFLAWRDRDDAKAAAVFASGTCASQPTSMALMVLFQVTDTATTAAMLVVALIFIGAPILTFRNLVVRG